MPFLHNTFWSKISISRIRWHMYYIALDRKTFNPTLALGISEYNIMYACEVDL